MQNRVVDSGVPCSNMRASWLHNCHADDRSESPADSIGPYGYLHPRVMHNINLDRSDCRRPNFESPLPTVVSRTPTRALFSTPASMHGRDITMHYAVTGNAVHSGIPQYAWH